MTNKEKIEELVKDLNNQFGDSFFIPNPPDGRFVLEIDLKCNPATFNFSFQDKEDNLVIYASTYHKNKSMDEQDLELFLGKCYICVFRYILFALDSSIGQMIDPVNYNPIHVISVNTLAKEGLKKIKDWKLTLKKCWGCNYMNSQMSETCIKCGEKLYE